MSTAQNHIEKRMQSLGYNDYSLQTLQIDIDSGVRKQIVNTCNEFLFLQNEILPEDIPNLSVISCDNFGFDLPEKTLASKLILTFSVILLKKQRSGTRI